MRCTKSPRSVYNGAVYTESIIFIRFSITFYFNIGLKCLALVPEAAAGMEKGSASITLEQN